MSKFTQGEWRYREVDPISEELNTHKYVLWAVGERTLQSIGYIFTEANARLIAAAPEMYDELYEVLQLLQGKSSYDGDEYSQHAEDIRELLACIDSEEGEE